MVACPGKERLVKVSARGRDAKDAGNFDTHKLAYMNCTITRDLHCFSMSASFVPVGPYKSYNFHIAVKSSLLADLKYDKRSSYSNGVDWY